MPKTPLAKLPNLLSQLGQDGRRLTARQILFGASAAILLDDDELSVVIGGSEVARFSADGIDSTRGQLDYAEITSPQTGITTITDITDLSVTFDVGSESRRIRTTVFVYSTTSSVSTDRGQASIADGSNTDVQRFLKRFGGTNAEDGFIMQVVETLTGQHTRKARYARSGTGSHTWVAATNAPSYILVEDLGPA